MGPTMITVSTDDTWGSRWGVGFWGEAGVQLMRTHETQFVVLGRLNVPTFKVDGYDYYEDWDGMSDSDSETARSAYAMPFEFVAAINFD